MKKILFRFTFFVLVLFIADWLIGTALKTLYSNSNDYTISKLKHTLNADESILIFGSSRAQHHYNSNLISNETGLSVYNCGFGGQGVKFSYFQLESILKHHKPKLIILDLSVNILLDKEGDSKLGILKPYYDKNSELAQELKSIDKFEFLKRLSKIYPYNSDVFNLLRNKEKYHDLYGFIPLTGKIDTFGISSIVEQSFNKKVELNDKFEYVEKFIKECEENKINLIIVNSPIYQTNSILDTMNLQMKCQIKTNNLVHYLDFTLDSDFKNHPEYFQDNLHLNELGANAFSIKLLKELKL